MEQESTHDIPTKEASSETMNIIAPGDQPETSVPLMLGDIIKIDSPENDIYHGRTFLIDFINASKINLVDTETFQQ